MRSAPSLPQTSEFPLHPGLRPRTHLKETPRGPIPVRATRIGQMNERRRRDRLIAWGVSPRYRLSKNQEAPDRGRQIAIAASAAIFLLSVAASRLENLSPCRVPGANAPGYVYAAASRLRAFDFARWASPQQVTPGHHKSRLVRIITTKRGVLLETAD